MAEKEHDDGEYQDENLGMWQRRDMIMENIGIES